MQLVILHTNDTHGQLTPVHDLEGRSLGGYARRASYIAAQRKRHEHVLLLDAGDLYQGSRFWHSFKGQADIELMNHLAYDVAALGNHDVDGGVEVLHERLAEEHFPTLCANMTFPAAHPLAERLRKNIMLPVGEEMRVGVFSLLTAAMELYPPDFREVVTVEPFIEVARQQVAELREAGADMVILLIHLGHQDDTDVADAVNGIDLIIGGHTHTGLWDMHIVNGTPIVRGIVSSPVIGRIIVDLQPHTSPRIVDYRLVELTDRFRSDPIVKGIVARWQSKLPPEEVVGRLANPIDTRGVTKNFGESAAGNLYADGTLAYFADEVDISMVHMGTIRGERVFPAGDFTNHDLAEYHPFDNPPIIMDLTAPQLKFMLERGVHEFPAGRGYFLSVAGLAVTIDVSRQPQIIDRDRAVVLTPGERIVGASFRGEAVDFTDETRVFAVVLDGYAGRGGSGFFMAKQGANIRQYAKGANAILRWYFDQHETVDCAIDGRITMVDA